jgi:hypothetical protein
MEQALGYTLSHPVSTAIVGITTLADLTLQQTYAILIKLGSKKLEG